MRAKPSAPPAPAATWRFSSTVMPASMRRPSGTSTSPRRTRSCDEIRVMSAPSKRTWPPRTGKIPASAISSVVLPAPFAPTIAHSVPSRSASETSCKTSMLP